MRNLAAVLIVLCSVAAAFLSVVRGTTPAVAAGTQLFSVVGGDYISPLITSPRGLQTLNLQMRSFGRFAGYDQLQSVLQSSAFLTGPGFVNITRYYGDLLSMLGAKFVSDGQHHSGSRRVFIAEAFWRTHFDPSRPVVGLPIKIGGEAYDIAGVVRTKDAILGETDFWIPLGSHGPYATMTALRVIGELNPGQDWRAGEKELRSLMHTQTVRDQVVEMDTVRLLPIDRRIQFYAAHTEAPFREASLRAALPARSRG